MVDVERILKDKGGLIDKEIEAVFPKKGVKNLDDAVWYHMGTRGKRLRPVLAIATCESMGGDVNKVLPFAAACEVLHNWFLVHDDIEDGDVMRRDKPTLWVKYSMPHGINVGDYMSEKVYELILKSKKAGVDNETIFRLLKATVDTSIKTAEGQAYDISLKGVENPSEKDYINMVTNKTAYYLTLPMVGGAIVAGADDKLIQTIRNFGIHIGPAFQIMDDVLDLTEGKGRGEIGRDIKEGKKSILVIHCMTKCSKQEKERLISILRKFPIVTEHDDVLEAKVMFEKYGSIEYANKKAKKLIEESKKIIKNLDPKLKEVLEFFADYIIQRNK